MRPHVVPGPSAVGGVRAATEADLNAIAAIYDEAVLTTLSTFDLEPQGVPHWRARLFGPDPVLVALELGQVVGVAYAGPFRPRPAYRHTRECSLYVQAEARGRGVGRRLYTALLDGLDTAGVHRTVAVVALPNPASVALHEATGFRCVGTLREVGHKFGEWVDVALYERAAPAG